MIFLNKLPDPRHFDSSANTTSISRNTVINATNSAPYHYPKHSSPLGVLFNFNGNADYIVNKRNYTLNDNYFFILNYQSEIEVTVGASNTQSLYIFFEPGIIQSAKAYFKYTTGKLLDSVDAGGGVPEFMDRLHGVNDYNLAATSRSLRYIKREALTEEFFYDLYAKLLAINNNNRIELHNLKTLKKSTLAEIYDRLYKAKYFIDENYAKSDLSLNEIATFSALNTFHFLRLFKQLFKITPHQYLINLRLKKAGELLVTTDCSILDVCLSNGFESIGSFCNLFKRKYNYTPTAFRQRHKN